MIQARFFTIQRIKMQDGEAGKALEVILKNCKGGNHSFRTIINFGEGMDSHTVKWCRKCGRICVSNCDAIVLSQAPEVFDLIAPVS